MKKYKVIGIMSGSSLDGVDIAYCEFYNDGCWHYKIIVAETFQYSEAWVAALVSMHQQPANKLIEYDILYGNYLGELVNSFIAKHKLHPDFISSHGHTVFHNPKLGYTFQLGSGQAIAVTTGLKTVCGFRIGDIQLGGQGAPLVPIGDSLLFSEFDFCINIGGIANISFNDSNKRIAFDICPANQLLNYISRKAGMAFDDNGTFASSGKINGYLSENLNNHPYYLLPYPKSMSNRLVTDTFVSIIDDSDADLEDQLYTVCEHIAYQIGKTLQAHAGDSVLITGGGAHNSFLVNAIKRKLKQKIEIPGKVIVDFKEALIFAFLGVLRIEEKINCLASATGAIKDTSTGVIYNSL